MVAAPSGWRWKICFDLGSLGSGLEWCKLQNRKPDSHSIDVKVKPTWKSEKEFQESDFPEKEEINIDNLDF